MSELGSSSQAKKLEKAYAEDMEIAFEAKMERVLEFIEGDFDGDLDELFEFEEACERDGKVLILGDTDLVKLIAD